MKINKRIAVSFVTIAGTLAGVVGITLAVFTNDASLANNTLGTGTPNLQISNFTNPNCGTFQSTSVTGVQTTKVSPGQGETKQFCLKNNNSESSISFDITAAVTVQSGNTLDPNLVDLSIGCGVETQTTGTVAVYPLTLITSLSAGEVKVCSITQTLSGTATNSAINQDIAYDVTFTGTQNP